jgi:HPt (histidine-containing phosphotransfer) domain-containing protein
VNRAVLQAFLDTDDTTLADGLLARFVPFMEATASAMRVAQRQGDGPALEMHAHKLRSSAQLVGAEGLATLCAQIERGARGGRAVELDADMVRFDCEVVRVAEHLAPRV